MRPIFIIAGFIVLVLDGVNNRRRIAEAEESISDLTQEVEAIKAAMKFQSKDYV